jgi:hypothetical protein
VKGDFGRYVCVILWKRKQQVSNLKWIGIHCIWYVLLKSFSFMCGDAHATDKLVHLKGTWLVHLESWIIKYVKEEFNTCHARHYCPNRLPYATTVTSVFHLTGRLSPWLHIASKLTLKAVNSLYSSLCCTVYCVFTLYTTAKQ